MPGDKKDKFLMMRDRKAALTPVYWNAIVQTSPVVKKIFGFIPAIQYNVFENGRVQTIVRKSEWEACGKNIAARLCKEPDLFTRLNRFAVKARKDIEAYLLTILNRPPYQMELEEQIQEVNDIFKLFLQYDYATVPAWFIAGDIFRNRAKKILGLSDEDTAIVAMPNIDTFATQMEQQVLKAALGKANPRKSAEILARDFYWIPFGYDGPTVWDVEYFAKKIKAYRNQPDKARLRLQELQKQLSSIQSRSSKILARKNFTAEQMYLIEVLKTLVKWTDERKMLDFQLFHRHWLLLQGIGVNVGLDANLLRFLFTHELPGLKTKRQRSILVKNALSRLNRQFITVTRHGRVKEASESEYQTIRKFIHTVEKTDLVQGVVASQGLKNLYRAKARIVLAPADAAKVKNGEFLVATMTSPDYLPAMNKAAGFITDEGGLTCHAAIVAREMNKPCVIGTKIATKVFRDGDLVEVDAKRGIVRKLFSND